MVVAGPVDEATKWGLLRGALALVSPSAYESLSLVVLEAWSVGTPVLVNGACATTRRHCATSGGGLWFEGFGAFDRAVERLVADGDLRAAMGSAGSAYVEARYRWPVVLDRYTSFLVRVAERARRTVGPAPR
ncbi:MAG: glycosyltransferase [Acidimicrobiia bacterium]|nr:glycosyltransferase [Acidimicrobiia bacterium]